MGVERTLGQQIWESTANFDLGGAIEEPRRHDEDAGDGNPDELEVEEPVPRDLMKHAEDYLEERWAMGRPVTDVRASPHHSQMVLASYGVKANASLSDPDGCMLVWNVAMRSRPELTFTSPSSVQTAR